MHIGMCVCVCVLTGKSTNCACICSNIIVRVGFGLALILSTCQVSRHTRVANGIILVYRFGVMNSRF